jgi:hypothetical protein
VNVLLTKVIEQATALGKAVGEGVGKGLEECYLEVKDANRGPSASAKALSDAKRLATFFTL